MALLVRGLYVWQISRAPFLDVRVGDAEAYHAAALRIAGGEWVGSDVFYQSPLYPYFLAIVYTLLNDSPTTIRAVQALVGAASCVLLALAGMSLFGRVGALAGLALAVSPAAIFLDGQLDKSVLTTLLLTALLAVLVARERARFTATQALAAGALLGLLALTRENALLLAAPLLAWLSRPTGTGRRLRLAGACLAGMTLVLAPVAVRNRAIGGELLLTTAQLGPNLYIGNHGGASGTYEPLVAGHGSARDERADATRLAEEAMGRPLSPAEVSRYWTARAFGYMRSEPVQWLRLTARKIALAVSVDELADTESQHVYADSSWILRASSPFSFGVVLALAAAGVVLTARRGRRLWILYAIGLTYFVSLIVFYVVGRYRFPLVPVLILLAAGGVDALIRREGIGRRAIAAAAVAALLAYCAAHLTREDVRAARAIHYAAIAATVSSSAAPTAAGVDDAIALYTRALEELPGAPSIEFGLATVLARAGRIGDALPHFRAAIAASPDHAEARYNYGAALAAIGQRDAAVDQLDEAVRLRPEDVEARMALGRTLLALERADAAAAQYERVIERQPRNVTALAALGIALTMAGRVGAALAIYDRALAIAPDDADVHNNLGWSLATTGRIGDAIPHFERALALDPAHANARENLARARGPQ